MSNIILTILECLGFYVISGTGIYKHIIQTEVEDITEFDKKLAIPYKPLIFTYDWFKVHKSIYLRDRQVKILSNYIKNIDNKIAITKDEEQLAILKADKLNKQMLLSYFIFDEEDEYEDYGDYDE